MNGSEVLTRRPQALDPRSSYESPEVLSDSQKMDLMAGDDTPYARAIDRLMKLEIVHARNDAMEADPSNKDAQLTKMTIAHAMNNFYTSLRSSIDYEKTKHLSEVRAKAAQEDLLDREKFEEIVLANARGEV